MTLIHVSSDYPVSVPIGTGGTTILVQSGDTVYYGDTIAVTAAQNQGSLTSGQSATVTDQPLWLRSAGSSNVSFTSRMVSTAQAGFTFSRPGVLATETSNTRFPVTFAATIASVTAVVNTAPTGQSIIVDILKNGSTIWNVNAGNRPTIAASANTSNTAIPDITSLAAGDYLQVQLAQVGSVVTGADLTVVVTLAVLV